MPKTTPSASAIPVALGLLLFSFLACSCSTSSTRVYGAKSVRQVDFGDAPQFQSFAHDAIKIGDALYPQIYALLADNPSSAPDQFNVAFKKDLRDGNAGETRFHQIRLNTTYFEAYRGRPGAFDQLMAHEMAHVAQHYYHPVLGSWLVFSHDAPTYWVEGIADYIAFKVGETNGWHCAECDSGFPDYRNGYSCAAAFLVYLESHYCPTIVGQLNEAMRHGGYSDRFFLRVIGKDLDSLWAEYRKSGNYTASAARMLKLQETLGFSGIVPPRDVDYRLNMLVESNHDPIMRDMLTFMRIPGMSNNDIQSRLALYLYLTQPGGSAEEFMIRLVKDNKAPGLKRGEHGSLKFAISGPDLDPQFPASRTIIGVKDGDTSEYHCTLTRGSVESAWTVSRAWRTAPDGKLLEEFPVK